MVENLAVAHPATSRHVRPFLTEPEPVAEAGAAKDEIIAHTRDFKPGAVDHLPSQNPSDNQLKIPTSNQSAANAFDFQRLGAARSPGGRALRLRIRETLAMRGGAEIVALARAPPEVLQRACAADHGLCL